VVTIDGPSGAGKTTVSKLLAERAGMVRLDTGAMYRACALSARREGVPWGDAHRMGGVARSLDLSFLDAAGRQGVFLAGVDVSGAIRTPEMSLGASEVSAHLPVREALVAKQREMGRDGGVVLEGRDTGTVVFPDAEVKLFLTASAEERARRRVQDLLDRGMTADYGQILSAIRSRDEADSTRAIAPLRPAEDAVILDSTRLDLDAVVGHVLDMVHSCN